MKLRVENGKNAPDLTLDDFNRIFLLPLFQGCFMDVLAEVELLSEKKDLPLSLKFSNY